jgi:hypothetical protein
VHAISTVVPTLSHSTSFLLTCFRLHLNLLKLNLVLPSFHRDETPKLTFVTETIASTQTHSILVERKHGKELIKSQVAS